MPLWPRPELLDRRVLARVEAGAAGVDLAQDGERQAQDHKIGRDRRVAVEGKRVSAVAVAGDRRHAHSELHGGAEMLGDPRRELLVAAADVIALIRGAEDVEPLAGLGLLVGAEQVDNVQRALVRRVGPVFDRIGDVEQSADRRFAAARDAAVDPLGDRHLIELLPFGRELVVSRRFARGFEILGDRLLNAAPPILVRLLHGVVAAEKLVGVAQARISGEVVERQAEASGEANDRLVIGVDQLSAPFADLIVRPDRRGREHPPADPVRRFVDRAGDSGVLQGERRVQPGDPRPDDGDAGFGRRSKGRSRKRRARRHRSGAGDELAPRRGGQPLRQQFSDRDVPALAKTDVRRKRFKKLHVRECGPRCRSRC